MAGIMKNISEAVKNYFTNRKVNNDGKIKADPFNNKVDVENAMSWNAETHPDGYGPSKLVKDIHFDNSNGDGKLDVTYRDGFTAEYKGITPHQAVDFHNADSKGRWALKNLWSKPYTAV